MVEISTEKIYGIKAYGVIHRGHYYGTLDEIDQWYWGDYTAYHYELLPHFEVKESLTANSKN